MSFGSDADNPDCDADEQARHSGKTRGPSAHFATEPEVVEVEGRQASPESANGDKTVWFMQDATRTPSSGSGNKRKNSISERSDSIKRDASRKTIIQVDRVDELVRLEKEFRETKCEEDETVTFTRMKAALKFFVSSLSCRQLVGEHFINSTEFNTLCGCMIILNALLIGFEMEYNVESSDSIFFWIVIESIFLIFFICETTLRFRATGCRRNCRDPAALLDVVLIIFGIVDTWIIQLAMAGRADHSDAMFKITLLRLVRLARIVRVLRVLRLFRYFKELVLLAKGILGALKALVWSFVLMFIILYVGSILTTSWYNYVARESPKDADGDLQIWFGSIGNSMLTLFQLITLEDWPEVVRGSMDVWSLSWLFLVPFMMLTNVSLLNAVTAVVVEKVFTIANAEGGQEVKRLEKNRKGLLRKVKRVCDTIGVDADSNLNKEDFVKAIGKPNVTVHLRELGIDTFDARELFDCLDTDESGDLTVTEFVDGCLRAVGPALSKHLLQFQYDIIRSHKHKKLLLEETQMLVAKLLKVLSKVHGRRKHRKPIKARRPSMDSAGGGLDYDTEDANQASPTESEGPVARMKMLSLKNVRGSMNKFLKRHSRCSLRDSKAGTEVLVNAPSETPAQPTQHAAVVPAVPETAGVAEPKPETPPASRVIDETVDERASILHGGCAGHAAASKDWTVHLFPPDSQTASSSSEPYKPPLALDPSGLNASASSSAPLSVLASSAAVTAAAPAAEAQIPEPPGADVGCWQTSKAGHDSLASSSHEQQVMHRLLLGQIEDMRDLACHIKEMKQLQLEKESLQGSRRISTVSRTSRATSGAEARPASSPGQAAVT